MGDRLTAARSPPDHCPGRGSVRVRSQRRNRLPVACTVGCCFLLLPRGLSTPTGSTLRSAELPRRVSAAQSQPLSCKVSSPVRVSLEPSPAPAAGTWRIHLDASQSVPTVRVTLWAATSSGEMPPQTVWQGELRRGEARDLDVPVALPADAREVFAQAEIVNGGGGAIMRSLAESPGPAAKAALAVSPQRVTVNPATGETVVEYEGRIGGAR